MIPHQRALLHLNLIDGVGPATIMHLINAYADIDQIYQATYADLMRSGLNKSMAHAVYTGLLDQTIIQQESSLCAQHDVQVITILDEAYPPMLKHIYAPPAVLYAKGDVTLLQDSLLAIVGSRAANAYGKQVVQRLVPELVAQGCTLVSGGALGIDGMVHQATLDAGGKTIVVLGSGLLRLYPTRHITLFSTMVQSGSLLISSFPLKMEPLNGNFPARNRIIAGMSGGCAVIQAAAKSGALITAEFALSYGRAVGAVPGPITDPISHGCHALIAQGATLLTCAKDMLECMGRQYVASSAIPEQAQQKQLFPADDPRSIIIKACAQPISMDQLGEITNLGTPQLAALLFDLQIERFICQNAAGLWEISSKI